MPFSVRTFVSCEISSLIRIDVSQHSTQIHTIHCVCMENTFTHSYSWNKFVLYLSHSLDADAKRWCLFSISAKSSEFTGKSVHHPTRKPEWNIYNERRNVAPSKSLENKLKFHFLHHQKIIFNTDIEYLR